MTITAEQLEDAGRILDGDGPLRAVAATLRERLGHVKVLVLDAFDMRSEKPVLKRGRRAAFLVRSDGHCWAVTSEPEQASGFVLVEE